MSRRLWIVLGLAAVVILIYGALIAMWIGSAAGVDPGVDASTEFETALEAYDLANRLALEWRNDAVLSSASSGWTNPSEAELLGGKTAWGFNFVSPAASELRTISVFKGRAGALKTSRLSSVPKTLHIAGWKVDSPEALSAFLDSGGREFLGAGHPEVNVNAHLSARVDGGGFMWVISAMSGADGSAVSIQVDATSGGLVEMP